MSAYRTNHHKKRPQPITFLLADSATLTSSFLHEKCVCKACSSPGLEFNAYLEDAKCPCCRQWQNEEIQSM